MWHRLGIAVLFLELSGRYYMDFGVCWIEACLILHNWQEAMNRYNIYPGGNDYYQQSKKFLIEKLLMLIWP